MRLRAKEDEESGKKDIEKKRKGMEEEKKRKKWSVKKAQSAGKDVKSNILEEKETPHRE